MGRRRAAALIGVNLLILAHIAQWKLTGRTVSPVEPSESMYTIEQGFINAGFIFFSLAILATLIFGRFVCGWGCHLVALQDWCGWIMKKIGVRPKPFRSRLLVYFPLVLALYMFVWPTFKREALAPVFYWFGWDGALRVVGVPPPFPGFSNHLMTSDFWATFGPVWMAVPFFFVTGFAIVYFLGAKGFCTYGCPYGGFFAVAEKVAPGRIVVDSDKCHQCGHCTAVCTSNVRVNEEILAYGMVVNPGCMKCMDCVSVCPNDALSFRLTKPAIFKGEPAGKPPRRIFDMTWPEEIAMVIVFIAAFFAWRGLYGLIPMLMAAGLAGSVAFLAWKLWRVVRDRNVRIIGAQLKRAGRVKPAGVVFIALAGVTLLLSAHSLLVRYQRWRGDLIDAYVLVSRQQVFSGAPDAVPPEMKTRAGEALKRYRLASSWRRGGIALADTPAVESRIAWLQLVKGERDRAAATLEALNAKLGVNDARSADLGVILAMTEGSDAAISSLESVLKANPRFALTRDMLVSAYLSYGRFDDAVELRRGAIDPGDPNHRRQAINRAQLASMLLQKGEAPQAVDQLRQAVELASRDSSIRNDYAVALFIAGQPERAIEQMRRAIKLAPDDAPLHLRFSQMLSQLGRNAEAQQMMGEARRLDPTIPSTPPAD